MGENKIHKENYVIFSCFFKQYLILKVPSSTKLFFASK